jgi:tetratricopeptide (TPR) repeat protein
MAIGGGYHSLRDLRSAEHQLKRALELRKAHLGLDHSDTRDSMAKLAFEYMWLARHSESIALRQQALESSRAVLGPNHPETRRYVNLLAEAYEFAGQLEASTRLFEQLLEQHRNLEGPTHPATLNAMHRVAWNYALVGRLPESMALFEKLYAPRKGGFGYNVGVLSYVQVCQWAGKYDLVDEPLRAAVKQFRKEADTLNSRILLAGALGFLAVNLLLQERFDEAEPLAREAIAMDQTEGSTQRGYWVSALGAVLLGQQKYNEAEPRLLEGYEGLKKVEASHPAARIRMTEVAGWIVRLYEATNQPEKARVWRERLKARESDAASPRPK